MGNVHQLRKALGDTASSSGEFRSTVPSRRTRFFGRKQELTSLQESLESGLRLVTVLGVAGCGKSRLLMELIKRLESLQRRVVFCDLAVTESIGGARGLVASALGHSITSRDAQAELGRQLRLRGPLVLLLDNTEHIAEDISAAVRDWLDEAPRLSVVVSSRVPLRLEGEQVHALEPLPVPATADGPPDPESLVENSSIALLVDRVRLVEPSFQVDQQTAPHLLRIVSELDGLPLAIELAASQVRTISLARLADRLAKELDLLRSRARDLSPRQATLQGALNWSWKLLEPWEQSAIAQCSVFVDAFSMEALEAVVDLSAYPQAGDLRETLVSLIDHCLVRRRWEEGEDRYGLLAPVRRWAAGKLEELVLSGDRLSLGERELDLEAGVVRAGDVVHSLTAKEAELLRYLLARAGTTVPREELLQEVWGYGPGVQTRTIDTTVRTLRSKLESGDPRFLLTERGVGYRFEPDREQGGARAAAELRHAAYFARHGTLESLEALEVSAASAVRATVRREREEQLAAAQRMLQRDEGQLLLCLVHVLLRWGVSVGFSDQAASIDAGLERLAPRPPIQRQLVRAELQQFLQAGHGAAAALRILEPPHESTGAWSEAHRLRLKLENGLRVKLESVAVPLADRPDGWERVLLLGREVRSLYLQIEALRARSFLCARQGDLDEAARLAEEAWALGAAPGGDQLLVIPAVIELARQSRWRGESERACELIRAALERTRGAESSELEGFLCAQLGLALMDGGVELDEAAEQLQRAARLQEALQRTATQSMILASAAEVELLRNRDAEAQAFAEQAVQLAGPGDNVSASALAHGTLARVFLVQGRVEAAAAQLREKFETDFGVLEIFHACQRGRVALRQGKEHEARELLAAAAQQSRETGFAESSFVGLLVQELRSELEAAEAAD